MNVIAQESAELRQIGGILPGTTMRGKHEKRRWP
jgi:hypothetical protein